MNKLLLSIRTFSDTFFHLIIICPITSRQNMLVCKYHVRFRLISNEGGIIWHSLVNPPNIKCNRNPLNSSPMFTAKLENNRNKGEG